MGIRTRDFVLGSIDSRVTTIWSNGQETFEDAQPKLYELKHQNISFAVIGKLLPVISEVEMGIAVRDKVNKMKTKQYRSAINKIVSEYRKAYAEQVSNPYDNQSFVMVWGYNPKTSTPFLYKCESPKFKPELVPLNEAFILGYDGDVYKENSIKIFKQLRINSTVNLWEWVKQTFDSHHNQYVNYPLFIHMYKKELLPWKSCTYLGDSLYDVTATLQNNSDHRSKFNVKLKYME
ncbi:hypothetical protein P4593_28860 [Priestia megaterium]|uniref:hypothetical protein n=1 Tax=Priestia megaterium TaxID=1404 RepID=UPI0030C9F3B8